MRLTEGEYEEFRARRSLRLIRKGVLAFSFLKGFLLCEERRGRRANFIFGLRLHEVTVIEAQPKQ